MSSDFVFGFIQCLDGEKDPRNLMLAFTLIKSIIQEFDIAQHVEVSQRKGMTGIDETATHRENDPQDNFKFTLLTKENLWWMISTLF